MSVIPLHEEDRVLARAVQDYADFQDCIRTMRAVHEMAAQARRGLTSGSVLNGHTALRRIEEETLDVLMRIGAAP